MDFTVISQLIGSLGFPIVACCAMFYMYNRQTEAHKEEMNKFTEAINNNTSTINELMNLIKERM